MKRKNIAPLRHKAINHTVESCAVIITRPRNRGKLSDMSGRDFRKGLDNDAAFGRFENDHTFRVNLAPIGGIGLRLLSCHRTYRIFLRI